MVRMVSVQVNIPRLNPQEVFECAFTGPEAALEYHLEINHDPSCQVGQWVDGMREVVFRTRVNAPPSITRMLGVETITIREVSTRSEEGSDIVVCATPLLDFPGGSKFSTVSCMRLSPSPTGCQMAVEVTCEAAGPWGLIGTIEDAMATQAAATIQDFAKFCQRWCAKHDPTAASASVTSPFARVVMEKGEERGQRKEEWEGVVPPHLAPLPIDAHRSISAPSSAASDDVFFDTESATSLSRQASSSGSGIATLRADLVALSARVHNLETALRQQKPMSHAEVAGVSRGSWPGHWSVPLAFSAVAVLTWAAVQYRRWSALSASRPQNH